LGIIYADPGPKVPPKVMVKGMIPSGRLFGSRNSIYFEFCVCELCARFGGSSDSENRQCDSRPISRSSLPSGLSVTRVQVSVAALVQRVAGRIGNDRSLNYRSFPRITVIDPAGSVYMPSGVAAVVMFLSSEGVLQYCTRATDPTNGWLMCLASSMTR